VTTARRVARDALVRVEAGAYSHVVLPVMLRDTDLSDRDRAHATALVYGALRAQRRLDELLAGVSARPLGELDPEVRASLRLGAEQLVQGVAPYAAVDETVAVAPARARGYVNGVLRSLARLGPPWPEPTDDAVALSYPDWLVARLRHDLGAQDARAALVAANEPPAVTLRPNPTRTTPAALRDELEAAGVSVETGALLPEALVVRGVGDPAALPAIREGRATPQDQASQSVVDVLAPGPGDRVLDVAAAPGGKATAAAERVGEGGCVVAMDVHAGRLRLVVDAARRLGLAAVVPVVADGRHPAVRGDAFDRVLVDAPCSGLGVLRRRPESRWRIDPATIGTLPALQLELVTAAAGCVRPGGTLVYSVCTLTDAETRGVAARIVAALPDFEVLAPPPAPWQPWGQGALLLPQRAGTDGMYVLILGRRDCSGALRDGG
jgi:16S rRNA (cytosine967-C5)-methyltransferase